MAGKIAAFVAFSHSSPENSSNSPQPNKRIFQQKSMLESGLSLQLIDYDLFWYSTFLCMFPGIHEVF